MMKPLVWIQPHPHGAILRHILNTINSFLCSSTKYFKNRLLPNDLIIVMNHEDDEEDERDIKRVLERKGDTHIKLEIQSNFRVLHRVQLKVQDHITLRLMYRTYTKSDLDVLHMHKKTMR
jgi:hypothetical protein